MISTLRGRFLGVLAVLLLVTTALTPTTVSAQSASDEATFISRVNQVRANNGLPALIQNNELTSLSRGWAQAQRDGVCGEGVFICHANPISEGVTQNWEKLGENVGTGGDVLAVMDAFVASPGHFANIVDPAFTHIGVGVVWDGNRLFTTHRFMTLRTAEPAPPPPTAAPTTTTTPPTTAPSTTAATSPSPPTTAATSPTTTPVDQPSLEVPVDSTVDEPADDDAAPTPDGETSPTDQQATLGTGRVNLSEERAAFLLASLQAIA